MLTVAVAGCSDAPTAAHSHAAASAVLSLSPLPRPSAVAAGVLSSFGLMLDHVRLVIVRPEADTLADTTASFATADTAVTFDLAVLAAPGEQLDAGVQYLSGSTVIYTGSTVVTTYSAGSKASGTNLPLSLRYVGPGAGAKKLSLTPDSGMYTADKPIQFTAVAIDSGDVSMGSEPAQWSVSDSTLGTITSGGGLFTPNGKRGSETVVATLLNGTTGHATIHLVPPAAKIVVVSGGGQTGQVEAPLPQPFVVQVQAADGTPVPGQSVIFVTTSGSPNPLGATTDANGMAQTTMTLGRTPGSATFTAVTGSFPATVTETAVVGTPALVAFLQQPTSSVTGQALSPAVTVQVEDAFGNLVPTASNSVSLAFDSTSAARGAHLGGTLSQAAINGVATFPDLTVDSIGQAYHLVASTGGLTSGTSNGFDIRPGPLSLSAVGGTSFTMTAGQAATNAPYIRVTDANGAVVGNITVHVTVRRDTSVLIESNVTSNELGDFGSWNQIVTVAGSVTVEVANPNLVGSPITFTITVLPAAPSRYLLSASNSRPLAGSAITFTATLVDQYGNAVPTSGKTVTWSSAGGGTFSSATSTTDANGTATVTFTTPTTAGLNPVISAADGSFSGSYYDLVTVAP